MTEYADTDNKLSIVFPTRFSKPIFRLLEHQSWSEHKYNAEFVRECVIDGLKKRGVTIPEPMTCWKELELKAKEIKAEQQVKTDESLFPPVD